MYLTVFAFRLGDSGLGNYINVEQVVTFSLQGLRLIVSLKCFSWSLETAVPY